MVAVPEEAKQVVKLTVIALAVVVARFAIYWVVTGSYVVGAAGLLGRPGWRATGGDGGFQRVRLRF